MALTQTKVSQLYVAIFNRASEGTGNTYWQSAHTNATTTAEAMFLLPAVATYFGVTNFTSTANVRTVIEAIYLNALGKAPADDTAGITYWIGQVTGGRSIGDVVNTLVVSATATANAGAAQNIFNNKVTVSNYAADTLSAHTTDAAFQGYISSVTAAASTVTTANAAILAAVPYVANPGTTFTLTTGSDAIVGTAKDDTIDATTSATLSAFDTVDGGAGRDTMNALITSTSMPGLATINNVENVNINTTGAGFTLSTTAANSFTGIAKVNLSSSAAGAIALTTGSEVVAAIVGTGASSVTVIGTGGILSVATGAGAVAIGSTAVANTLTKVSVVGGTTVAIQDRSGASAATGSTLTEVVVTGTATTAADITLTGNAITTVSIHDMTGSTTVGDTVITAAAGARTLNLDIGGIDVGNDAGVTSGAISVTDATATALNLTSTGKESFDSTVVAGVATAVTVAATAKLTMVALTVNTAATIAFSGTALITIAGQTMTTTTAITSTNSAGVVLAGALVDGVDFDGGAGKDSITIGGNTTGITMGAGNDTVTLTEAQGTGGTVDAGAGTGDTLSLTSALAYNDSLSASTAFNATVSNFEIVALSDTGSGTINMTNLDNVGTVVQLVNTASNVYNNAAAGFTHEIRGTSTNTTINVLNAARAGNLTDVVNIKYNVATSGGSKAHTLHTIAATETINVNSTVSGTIAAGDINTLTTLTATHLNTLNITGDTKFVITNAITTASIRTVDGSTSTGGVTYSAAAAVAGITLKGSAAVKSAGHVQDNDNILTGGAGADSITGGTGIDTILGGAGNDIITAGAGVDALQGGGGNDVIILTETIQAIDVVSFLAADAGNDAVTDFVVGAGGDQVGITYLGAGAMKDAAGNADGTHMNWDLGGRNIANANEAVVISTVTGAFDGSSLTTQTTILNVNLAANFVSNVELATALEVGGDVAFSTDAAIAAKDMVFVTWDDGTDSYLSHVEFNAVVANNAAAADGVLAITDLITFSGVADSSTLVAANFDLI